jgi:hypothetical protein
MKYIKKFESNEEFDNALANRLRYMNRYSATTDFWKFVDLVEWGKCTETYDVHEFYDIKNVMKRVAPHYNFEKFKQFQKEYQKLYHFISDKFYEVDLEVSDDGFTDLMSSVIGFGKKHFMKIIMDESFKKLKKMRHEYNYCENFGYVFHILYDIESDYEPSKIEAEKIRDKWNKIYTKNNPK